MGVYIPDRGDLIWLNFNPQAGHEQSGYRPAFVVSPKEYNKKVGLSICCPVTSQIKGYPFEAVLPDGLKTKGAVLSDQVKNLDWHVRKAKYIERAPSQTTKEILGKIKAIIA